MRLLNTQFFRMAPILLVTFFSVACMGPVERMKAKYPGYSYIEPPETPIPLSVKDLSPGLAVVYFYYFSGRDIDSLPSGEDIIKLGVPGPPIMDLDNQFEYNEVFQSGVNREVGLEMSGYIKLDKAGDYFFQANSNDGFCLYIDNLLLIDDSEYHSDRLSHESVFKVQEPAWYPLKIRYFQRKGSATLQLFWKPPGENKLSIVPPEVLAHTRS